VGSQEPVLREKLVVNLPCGEGDQMVDHVIVWDLETVPDLAAVARIHDLALTDTALIREALVEKFPKHLFHSIVCIGALIAQRTEGPGPWEVVKLGAPHIGERSEAELISGLCRPHRGAAAQARHV
jgi:hypothetical protein